MSFAGEKLLLLLLLFKKKDNGNGNDDGDGRWLWLYGIGHGHGIPLQYSVNEMRWTCSSFHPVMILKMPWNDEETSGTGNGKR